MYHIYELHLNISLKHKVKEILNQKDISKWLKLYANIYSIYEVYKNNTLKSRWIWNIKKNKWVRMSTPKKF
tara:strand:- start:2652 stop:2864 length:213 start_codon:yes stop_codon:yes gene_type:complete